MDYIETRLLQGDCLKIMDKLIAEDERSVKRLGQGGNDTD